MGHLKRSREKREAIEAGIRSSDPARQATKAEIAVGRQTVRGLYDQCGAALEPVRAALPAGSVLRDSVDLVRKTIGELGRAHDGLMGKLEDDAPE